MNLKLLVFIQIFLFISNEEVYLSISRSRTHEEQTGKLTPLLISLSTDDTKEKMKGVDFVCVVDTSGSMAGSRITLVKESLNYLINLMNPNDNFALVTFESSSQVVSDFIQMTPENKKAISSKIDSLKGSGGTNILSGLKSALELIKSDYSSGERICSMILLSDGEDNRDVDTQFKKHISDVNKDKYVFSLHTMGYGEGHDGLLMYKISLIRDGGYFYIRKLPMVQDAYLEIYGSLSTTCKINVELTVQSNFPIEKIYGMEDMYEASLIDKKTFKFKLIHFVYGKKYNYVALVNVPGDTKIGTVILSATVSPFEKTVNYYWNQAYSISAYEEYIKCISFTYFLDAYNYGKEKGVVIMENAINWLKSYYYGLRNWLNEYNDVLNDIQNLETFGKQNILSKLRELKSSKLGIHYNDENSYQKEIIDNSHNIDVSDLTPVVITGEKTVITGGDKNYHYFYLKEGIGEINGVHFSEEGSSLIVYTEKTEEIKINPITNSLKYYYWSDSKTRIQTLVDFSREGKFMFKKDFPFDFYSRIDGTKDITFNIQFLNFEYDETSDDGEPDHLFEIKAYIVDEQQIDLLKIKTDSLPTTQVFEGYYDKGFRVGKVVIKKENITQYLNSVQQNYLYVVVRKVPESNINYNLVVGQFSFVSMNYIYLPIPENFYIFSNLFQGQMYPHLYSIKMEPSLSKKIRIEFASAGDELDCKILKFYNYDYGSEELYVDYEKFKITRIEHMGKTYIEVTQSDNNDTKFDKVILSIFSKNGDHIAGSEARKLSYTIRYSSYSNYKIYNFNDLNGSNGEIEIIQNDEDIKVTFAPLQYKLEEGSYAQEKTRFFIKVYPFIKKRQHLYEKIALFEDSKYDIFLEKIVDSNITSFFEFKIDTEKSYFVNIFTMSNINNEILSYKIEKIYKIITDIEIDDDTSYESELNLKQSFSINVGEDITKKYLFIQVTDFDEGEYALLYAKLESTTYSSIEPSNNYIIIPKEKCAGKTIDLEIKLKDNKSRNNGYSLLMNMVDKIEINAGENLVFQMREEYNGKLDIIINNSNENKMNIFVRSNTGEFSINSFDTNFVKSDFFGALSSNVESGSISMEINAKAGEFISIFTHIINNPIRRIISNYYISLYGYLNEKDCIYFDEKIFGFEKYQVRILGDKEISIKYNQDSIYDYSESGILYLKEFGQYKKLEKICIQPKNYYDSIFFSLQIINTSNQKISNVILQPSIFGALYNDILYKNEVRYYRQGSFDSIAKGSLRYLYNVRQIEGEIKVFISKCDTFPSCSYSKENLERNNDIISLYNINDNFIYSEKSTDLTIYNPSNIYVYIILCLSDICKYSFIINKSTSSIDLTQLQKYSAKISKNNVNKFTVLSKNEKAEMISVTLYTHTGEVFLSSNEICENIKYTRFGHVEKMEIPKSCNINQLIEISVQANMDSVYSIEYSEIINLKYSKIKSNIVHIENIDKEKTIEFTPITDLYFLKFIPINCEINIKYNENNYVPSKYNIYYYYSDSYSNKYYNFTIITKNSDCMIYTYMEELNQDLYSILSDQVPYYLTLDKNNKNYKLIYPLPHAQYEPIYRINFYEETPIKIRQLVGKEKDDEINALFMKNIKPSSKILQKCDNERICYLVIEIKYEEEIESPVILEIIPKSSNKAPGVLFDNEIKQDFTQLWGNGQQYMAKILKNEEGEVRFNYKYFSGELIGKLIPIDNKPWKNIYDSPKKNKILLYDNFKQKISFTKAETNICEKGCYLFIEVNSVEKLKDVNDYDGQNMDFSIFLKKSNNTVKIRLNEYIYGALSKTIKENYNENYSLELPYPSNEIIHDYLMQDIEINTTLTTMEHCRTEVFTKKNIDDVALYRFRLRLNKNYTYSDSNTESFCITRTNNETCYFIIPIINNQKNLNLFLYALSSNKSEDLILSYKKVKSTDNLTNAIKDNYEKTSKGQFVQNMLFINNSELNISENDIILIKIDVPHIGEVSLLHTFKSSLYKSLLSPINRLLYRLNPNEELFLDIPNSFKSLVLIRVIEGKAKVGYKSDENNLREISGKDSSIIIHSEENNEQKGILIKADSESSFYFYTLLQITSNKRNINKFSFGSSQIMTNRGFPIEFYSRFNLNEDYIINFKINNIKDIINENSKIAVFSMKAFIITEEILEKLQLDETFIYLGEPFIGKYESSLGIAKLSLTKEDIKKYYVENKMNYIYIIIMDSYDNPYLLDKIIGEISFFENNNLNYITPENTYINGNLEVGKQSYNKYKLIKKNSKDKKIRVEFSSASDDVQYRINYEKNNSKRINYNVTEKLGKKNIDIELDKDSNFIIFEVYTDEIVEDKNKLSYIIRYRTDEGKKIFKNYDTIKNINEAFTKNENKNDKVNNIELTISSIQDSETSKQVPATYYLNIYKYNKEDFLMHNSISIIDSCEPYKSYEFKFEGEFYKKNIEIPIDGKYYITLRAVTPDKEFLSYKSLLINNNKEDEVNDNNSDIYRIIVIVCICVILLIVLFIIIHFCCLKKRIKNVEIDDIQSSDILLDKETEEKLNVSL